VARCVRVSGEGRGKAAADGLVAAVVVANPRADHEQAGVEVRHLLARLRGVLLSQADAAAASARRTRPVRVP